MAQLARNYSLQLYHQILRLFHMNEKPNDAFPLHGKIMLLVWTVMAPLSIFFAKFGRRFMPRAVAILLHIICNIGMIACGGFAVHLSYSSCKYHLTSFHQKLGMTIAALSIVQGLLGVLLAIFKGRILWLRKIHGCLGISLWFAAVNNAFLGSEMLGWNIEIYLAAYMFLMIATFIALSCSTNNWFENEGETIKKVKKKTSTVETIKVQGLPSEMAGKKRRSSRKIN